MVAPGDANRFALQLTSQGIRVWFCGGWSIDALPSEHTKLHEKLGVEFPIEISRQRTGSSLGKMP